MVHRSARRAACASLWSVVLGSCSLQASANTACESCPQVLLKIASDGQGKEVLQLQDSGLDYLSKLAAPVHVVPILGIYRSGKSMLLNHVVRCKCFAAQGGDQTVTRGIFMCAEPLPAGGTVVWMDTEGLFSSEAGASKLGPRISTLALLTSSAVMLNTMNTYDERWVNFFDEQQKMAHILREQLNGLPEEAKSLMMPRKLPLFWVLSRPQDPSADHTKSLQRFLESKTWRGDFDHEAHMIPFAVSNNKRISEAWSLSDGELEPEYLMATGQLREKILSVLHVAHGVSPYILVMQLKSFMNLVNNDNFNPDDAIEIFQEEKIESLSALISGEKGECSLATLRSFKEEIQTGVQTAQQLQQEYVIKFKFSEAWLTKSEATINVAEINVVRDYLRRCWRFGPAIKPFIPWIIGLYFRDTNSGLFSILKRITLHSSIYFVVSILDISTILLWFGVTTATMWYEHAANTAIDWFAFCLRTTPSILFVHIDTLLTAIFTFGVCWMKINALENQAEYAVKRHLASSATAAARCLLDGSAPRAADALFEGLVALREATLSAGASGSVLRGLESRSAALKRAKEAVGAYRGQAKMVAACQSNKLLAHTSAGEWEKLVLHMADLLVAMETAASTS
eukprot:TRINITY_DN28892_c0_g1_i2.p1 TRINITY_DN28892_c0_g1~~TRINITY_DN28892_c0_g1_i2.p1  ORF type:complete len:641 (+),score=71.98 TRINITY_DN28892_c0_g1_i2:47-1924(+)